MKRSVLQFVAILLLGLAVYPAFAQSVLKEKKSPTIMKFLVDASPEYTTMVKLINAARLTETLESPGPVTMFAPVNKAFDVFAAGTVENWQKPEMIDSVKRMLTYHVIAGNWTINDLEQQIKAAGGEFEVPTIGAGKLFFVKEHGSVMVKDQRGFKTALGVPVVQPNGTVYRMDKILLR